MSLTSYRAAPPRVKMNALYMRLCYALCRPGNDLLSRVLRQSTIGAGAFNGRVRHGIGCFHSAITTRSVKFIHEKLEEINIYNKNDQVD